MNTNNLTIQEATEEAAHEHITAIELDIIVSNTRKLNKKRDRDIERIHTVLSSVEEQLAD